ncbi:MAG: MFS transporter [Cyanobacteria bacterium REEB65]|nr:MFS transporter [Cyanobacteria bacterium REEB65]
MPRLHWAQIHAWALFDLAYTVWSMNVLSVYFQLYVLKDLHAPDLAYSATLSAAMAVVALLAPILGAWSDRQGCRVPHMACWCIVSVAATAWIGFSHGLLPALALFFVACIGNQLAQVFYNAKLPEISTPATIGRISGYGIAMGFVGSILGMAAVLPFVTGKLFRWRMPIAAHGNIGSFLPTAILFLAFALPALLILRDRGVPAPAAPVDWKKTWRDLGRIPHVGRYLLANLLFFDAVNTVIAFMSTYCVQVVGFDAARGEVQLLLMTATVWAIAGAWLWGLLSDRLSPKRALTLCLGLWVLVFLLAIGIRSKAAFFWTVGPLAGLCMGGTGVTARPLLADLVPAERQGEFFGLWSLFGRFAAILGPLVWGLVTTGLAPLGTARYPIALAVELGFLLTGLAVLQKVPDSRRQPRIAT